MSTPADAAWLAPIVIARGDLRVAFHWFHPATDIDRIVAAHPDTDVHVWLTVPDVGGDRDACIVTPWLSEPELARRSRIQHPRALAEFLAGRRLIRSLVGALVGVAPRDLAIIENAHGAPSLDPARHATAWRFNLSHTDGLLALAVARSRIGIDVEWTTRRGRTVELADRYFAPTEFAALRALPEPQQRDRFFDLWTLKEAYIKARGMGLAIPLRDFAYTFGDRRIDLTVAAATRDVPDASWRFLQAQVGTHHRLALAIS